MLRSLTVALLIIGGLLVGLVGAYSASGQSLADIRTNWIKVRKDTTNPSFYLANATVLTMDTAHHTMVAQVEDPYDQHTVITAAIQYTDKTSIQGYGLTSLSVWQLHMGDTVYVRFTRRGGPFVADSITQITKGS